jgi:hypothetical protein
VRREEILVDQLHSAVSSRIVIARAKGALAQLHGCTLDDASDLLRTYARRHQHMLGHIAQAVLQDPTSVPENLPSVADDEGDGLRQPPLSPDSADTYADEPADVTLLVDSKELETIHCLPYRLAQTLLLSRPTR